MLEQWTAKTPDLLGPLIKQKAEDERVQFIRALGSSKFQSINRGGRSIDEGDYFISSVRNSLVIVSNVTSFLQFAKVGRDG